MLAEARDWKDEWWKETDLVWQERQKEKPWEDPQIQDVMKCLSWASIAVGRKKKHHNQLQFGKEWVYLTYRFSPLSGETETKQEHSLLACSWWLAQSFFFIPCRTTGPGMCPVHSGLGPPLSQFAIKKMPSPIDLSTSRSMFLIKVPLPRQFLFGSSWSRTSPGQQVWVFRGEEGSPEPSFSQWERKLQERQVCWCH